MKNMSNSLKILEEAIKNKKSIIVNYGKGYSTSKNILEPAYWNEEKGTFISETGVWSLKLLYEIARGEVDDTTIELA